MDRFLQMMMVNWFGKIKTGILCLISWISPARFKTLQVELKMCCFGKNRLLSKLSSRSRNFFGSGIFLRSVQADCGQDYSSKKERSHSRRNFGIGMTFSGGGNLRFLTPHLAGLCRISRTVNDS
jgi:hypothetical protein